MVTMTNTLAKVAEETGKETCGTDQMAEGRAGDAVGTGMGSYIPSLNFQGPKYALSELRSILPGVVASKPSWLQKVCRCIIVYVCHVCVLYVCVGLGLGFWL